MKRILLALAAVFCLAIVPQAQAQNYYQQYYKLYHPNEISVSYGASLLGTVIGSVVNKANLVSGIVGDDDYVAIKNGGTRGVLNLGYTYQLNKVISVGATASMNRMSINIEDNTGKLTAGAANIYCLMSTGKFDWFRTRSDVFGMYSKVGLGVMAIHGELAEDKTLQGTLWLPTGHLTAVGLEVGRAFSGFMEFGVGMQGIVQAGIRARF
jgi:hypothetical protein